MGASDIVKGIKKQKGNNAAKIGNQYQQVSRLSTGIFELDLATGGGLIKGKVNIIYGVESSNKTNVFYTTIAHNQNLPEFEDKYWVLVDIENSFDGVWASRMGVDLSRIIVTSPDTAEEAIDQVQAFMDAEDVAMVGVDSVAALISSNELDGAGDRVQVGGSSILVQSMIKKAVSVMQRRNKGDTVTAPTLYLINQIRMKIGVMFGNPETIPGGNAQNFAASLKLRFYGKDIFVNKKDDLPVCKHTNVIVKKNKAPIVATKCEFQMRTVPDPEGLIPVGSTDCWNTLKKYMQIHGLLKKAEKGSGWEMYGEKFQNLDEVKATIFEDKDNEIGVKDSVIREALISAHGPKVLG